MDIWENIVQFYLIFWLTIQAHAAKEADKGSAFWKGFLFQI
jgi:hypothetical protein